LTKKNKQRESVVANEYNKVVNEIINKELPKDLKITFHHYDVKAKKKEEKGFPMGLFALAQDALSKIGVFHLDSNNCERDKKKVYIQRGVIRTNCIDSLDRTNLSQELTGYIAVLEQLKRMGVIKETDI